LPKSNREKPTGFSRPILSAFQEWLSVWMYQQEAEGNIPKKEKQSDRQQTQKAWPIQKTDSEKDRRY
jgi:hypothetical protein